jgi:hypothetical protein
MNFVLKRMLMFNFIEPICCYKKGFADPFRVSYNGLRLVVSAGLGERNYQLKNKLQWKQKI